MRRANSTFRTGFISEEGTDVQNKTYFAFVELDRFICLAIAESFDDDRRLKSAKLAVQTALSIFSEKPSMSKRTLKKCIRKAHEQLTEESVNYTLKASIGIIVSDYTKMRYGLCGNTKIHVLRDNHFLEKSKTQTKYQSMIDDGEIPLDGSFGLEEINNLLYFLGNREIEGAKPYISSKIKLRDNDMLLMTTSSLWKNLNDIEILDAFEQAKDENQFLADLQDLTLSKQSDKVNSYSAAAVHANKIFKEDNKKKKKYMMIGMIAAIVVGLFLGSLFCLSRHNKRVQKEIGNSIHSLEKTGDAYLLTSEYSLANAQYLKASEETKELKNKKEKATIDERMLGKSALALALEKGNAAFEQKNYSQAAQLYQSAANLCKKYPKLMIGKELQDKLAQVDFAMEVGYLKEFAELLESVKEYDGALDIYHRVEQMVRISGDPKERQDVRLKIFGLEQEIQKANEENVQAQQDAEKLQVINTINEKKREAEQAVLGKDLPAAIAIYQQVRNEFTSAGAKEEADAVYTVILDLETQLLEENKEGQKQNNLATLNLKKIEAQQAVLEKDFEKALKTYQEIYAELLTLGEDNEAKATHVLIQSLETQMSEMKQQEVE